MDKATQRVSPLLQQPFMSCGEGNHSPVRRGLAEWSISAPLPHTHMRKLIGYILGLSWDCHFLSLWPVHQSLDSYRRQGAEEQTRRLVLDWGPGLKGLWDRGRLLRSVPSAASYEGCLEKSSAGPRPRGPPCLNAGGHQHRASGQMALHDVITIWEEERNVNGTLLLKEKSQVM